MKRILVTLFIFFAGATTGWLASPKLPTPTPLTHVLAPIQYELKREPAADQLGDVEWQMCQLGQIFYCSLQSGDDNFTAHLKAEGRWYPQ